MSLKPTRGLGVATDGVAVEAVEDAIGASAAPGGDGGPHVGVAVGGVEIVQPVPIVAGHVAALVEGVFADIDCETPAGEDGGRRQDPALVGIAGR